MTIDSVTPRLRLLRHAYDLAAAQDEVVTLPQLYGLGLPRWMVRNEFRARRWQRRGRQAVTVHNGPLVGRALAWVAVFNTGADAALDGVSALIDAGLEGWQQREIQVSVSKGARYSRSLGVRVYETRRRQTSDVEPVGLPRVKPGIAAVRAALWARSDRQAATLLAMTVQQGVASGIVVAEAFASVRRHKRRAFLRKTIADIVFGAESMGELDFLGLCRRRGLPSPSRQVRRVLPSGRAVLDVYWDEFGVVVEIEGVHHLLAGVALYDSVRQNELTIAHDRVLRIPVLGLRVAPDELLDQVERLLRQCGWRNHSLGSVT